MSKRDDGGPAFPVNELDQVTGHIHAQHLGLSLRDWFAAQAIVGITHLCAHDTIEGVTYAQHVARIAYETADAMLAARGATQFRP